MIQPDLRAQVALCCRMLEANQIIDFNGHVSARIPGTDRVYINPRGQGRSKLKPEDIVCVDLEGRLLEGGDEPPSETPIHLAIYRRRADVGSVAHLHPAVATVFSIAGVDLLPVFAPAAVLGGPLPVYDEPDLITTMEQAEALARVLGDGKAVLMRGHGAVTVGASVEEVFAVSVYLEENAKKQLAAAGLARPRPFTREEVERLTAQLWTESIIRKVWSHYAEKLGRV